MHNRWKNKKISILSYTYEDFDQSFVIGGRQKEYNQFIEKDADWVLIIINGKIGGITLEEYQVAMNAFMKNGKPKIIALAKQDAIDNSETIMIKEEINSAHQYWTEYKDIEHFKQYVDDPICLLKQLKAEKGINI